MIRRRLALPALVFFLTGLVSPLGGELLRLVADSGEANHPELASCPDPADDGHPCGPECECTCCPGHATGLVFVAQRFSLRPLPSDEHKARAHDTLHPQDVLLTIFHPPRV